ncbi:CobW family GTP-binding protein [Paenibacillus abyssi]|uniref:ATP-binding protein n=1 Tax=Paenibacillus abyssi TaxID=1340531 RepID=A0A917G2M8_9BACL|nr:GTP-binding protein [Paenibacillus abyssi]GGG19395.1 ATP-binding protein [Paenibacillus abyssi]
MPKIPVIILSGFLGSGKTSLLTKALKQNELQNSAIIVNEFGKIGLDHHLLSRVEERTLLLGGGCVCCSTREDLVAAILALLNDMQSGVQQKVDRVIVETTGLADPSPIWFTILRHPVLQHHFDVDRILVTLDAVNGMFHLDQHEESIKQTAVADQIIITKTDIASGEQIEQLLERIASINPAASIGTTHADDPDGSRFFVGDAQAVRTVQAVDSADLAKAHAGDTCSISIRFDRPLDWHAFGLWLSMLLHARGTAILRVKGLLDLGGEGPVSLNGVQHIIHPPEHLDHWPEGIRASNIVFIMKQVEPQQILDSLLAFQHVLGAVPYALEVKTAI